MEQPSTTRKGYISAMAVLPFRRARDTLRKLKHPQQEPNETEQPKLEEEPADSFQTMERLGLKSLLLTDLSSEPNPNIFV